MKDQSMGKLKLRITGWPEASDDDVEAFCDESDDFSDEGLAFGTVIEGMERTYFVTVLYRDPIGPEEFESVTRRWNHDVSARSPEAASHAALRDFRLIESLSLNHWRREVVSVSVSQDPPC